MNIVLLDNIPFAIHTGQLQALLKTGAGGRFAKELDGLAREAEEVARPKALYKISSVEHRDDDSVYIDGLRIASRVVKINLNACGRVFPFIATCGVELEEWATGRDSRMRRFWADAVQMMALGSALHAMQADIRKRFGIGSTSTMNPGSLNDWPISGQHDIFNLFGDRYAKTGIRLTDRLMMKPLKSVSGLEFESGEKFYNCQLCPKNNCPMRRAPYDDHLYPSRYQVNGN